MTADASSPAVGAAPTRRSRKWWPIVGAIVGLLAGFAGYISAPRVYEASVSILVIPQRVPEEFVRPTVTGGLGERLDMIGQQILSRTRLERIIQEFNLYEPERERLIMQDVVEQMRRDISFSDSLRTNDQAVAPSFRVAFRSPDARTAMRVTERLASLFVQENIEDRSVRADQISQFLQLQADEMRRRLVESQALLATWNQQNGGRPPPADLAADHEVSLNRYRDLVRKLEDAKMAVNLELRQIGEQFKVIDGARLPERPIGPAQWPYLVRGALSGLVASLLLMLLTSMWHRRRRTVPTS